MLINLQLIIVGEIYIIYRWIACSVLKISQSWILSLNCCWVWTVFVLEFLSTFRENSTLIGELKKFGWNYKELAESHDSRSSVITNIHDNMSLNKWTSLWFLQDGAPAHSIIEMSNLLNNTFRGYRNLMCGRNFCLRVH